MPMWLPRMSTFGCGGGVRSTSRHVDSARRDATGRGDEVAARVAQRGGVRLGADPDVSGVGAEPVPCEVDVRVGVRRDGAVRADAEGVVLNHLRRCRSAKHRDSDPVAREEVRRRPDRARPSRCPRERESHVGCRRRSRRASARTSCCETVSSVGSNEVGEAGSIGRAEDRDPAHLERAPRDGDRVPARRGHRCRRTARDSHTWR